MRARIAMLFAATTLLVMAALAAGQGANAGDSIFLSVLPPGNNGNSAGGIGVPVPGVPVRRYPDHFVDQLALYGDLSYARPGLKTVPCAPPTDAAGHAAASDLACNYYKHEGLEPDAVTSQEILTAPSGGRVLIRRDGWGVPFIRAGNRRDAMYGVGYAAAQDRLWLYDLLRNLGRGRLSEFLGPAASFYEFDASLAVVAGYDEDELGAMADSLPQKFGSLGALVLDDIDSAVAGVNAYITTLRGRNRREVPPEYAVLKQGGFPPPPFTRNDIIASATLVQSVFATGGGQEHINELFLQALDPTFTAGSTAVPVAACALWRDLRHADDPDAARTIDGTFRQSPAALDESCPQNLPAGAAVWDVGSFTTLPTFVAEDTRVSAPRRPRLPPLALSMRDPEPRLGDTPAPVIPVATRLRAPLDPVAGARRALRKAGLGLPDSFSNFIAVTASHSASGHPIAVMGPQTSYFVPQLLWEAAIQSTGGTPLDFAGRGIVFAHLPYIEIGRGTSYAWSATSGNSDMTDIRVSKLCNRDGSPPSGSDTDGMPNADGYLFDAGDGQGPQCRALYRRTDEWIARPTLASIGSGGPAGRQTVTRHILRTHYGPVFATATAAGAPVALSIQRSTFRAELDTAVPFALASTPSVTSAQDFLRLFNSSTGTFNWLYVNGQDVAYLHSGLYPLRHAAQSPDLPVWGDGRYDWAAGQNLPPGFFDRYGGDIPYPDLLRPVAQGDPLKGYFEWTGFMPLAQHPQAINPAKGWIASWNNSPAAGWWAADGTGKWGPTHRIDLLAQRLAAFDATGRKFDFANMAEIAADAGYSDLRGHAVLPLLLALMQTGPLDDTQQQVVALMQQWIDDGSGAWISGLPGLGAWRRDRDNDGLYDHRQAVVLMDAWYPHLIDGLLPQLTAITAGAGGAQHPTACSDLVLQCPYDAPRAQGSAYEYGYYELMKRLLEMALGSPGHTDYRALHCAGGGTVADCRDAVLLALDRSLTALGGWNARAQWDGRTLVNFKTGSTGQTVEAYDAIEHESFSLLPVSPIPWVNRPTFQQIVEIHE
ncbi:MAG: penicillin acylase family protein [Candidatus Rokubacteria bacterium]|nr:penicillin acylase family protein [Candidatus Rokubacteria bacterium]